MCEIAHALSYKHTRNKQGKTLTIVSTGKRYTDNLCIILFFVISCISFNFQIKMFSQNWCI